ncbi:MAG: hypothetical protein JNG90_14640 [Planctomycetaceae bacterium]|nr:hypothetical protein [Planctomycetaceae bacterium]
MSTSTDLNSIRQDLDWRSRAMESRLRAWAWWIRGQLLLEGLAWFAATALLLALVSYVLDRWLRLGLPTRLTLLPMGVGLLGFVAWRKIIRPLCVRLAPLDLAALLDARRPGLGVKAANVMQLPTLLDAAPQASPALVRRAVWEDYAAIEASDLTGLLDAERRKRFAQVLAAVAAVALACCLIAPANTRLWAQRWLLGSNVRWPQRTYLGLAGLDAQGRLLVPRGEPVIVEADAAPEFAAVAGGFTVQRRGSLLFVPGATPPQSRSPRQVSFDYREPNGTRRRGLFARIARGRFRYELPPVVEPIELAIAGGDDWLEPITVWPVDRPTLASLTLLAGNPAQPDSAPVRYEGAENPLLFLPRTPLELQLTSRVPLSAATLSAKSGVVPQLERVDATHYRAQWKLGEPLVLEIQLTGAEGGLASKPTYLSLGILKDREPRVTLRSSGVGKRVTPQATIPLNLRATDDFALAGLQLEVERTAPTEKAPPSEPEKISLALPPPDPAAPLMEFTTDDKLTLQPRAVTAGTMLRIRGSATDHCLDGPQSGSSRWLTFQVVTPEELFYEILMRQRAQRAKFAGSVAAAKQQQETLAVAVTPEQAPALIRTHQVVSRQVWEVGNRLEAALVEMQLNELGSAEALELLATKVVAPLRELHSDPLARQRNVLQELVGDPAAFAPALDQSRELQAEIVQRMETILAQMSQWESFVDVLNQLQSIIKLQSEVLNDTQSQEKTRTQDVFDP